MFAKYVTIYFNLQQKVTYCSFLLQMVNFHHCYTGYLHC